MSTIPKELRYSKDHEWINVVEGNIGLCGITFHAQQLLTDIVFVELPEMGLTVEAGERVAVVESVKAVSDVFSPVGGKILEVNNALEDEPALINTDPYEGGWIYKIGMDNPEDLEALMTASAYEKFITTGK
jgi:glycine cleavage system H protein